MALLKERVELGDVRLTLLNLLASEGTPHYHFIPLMIETAEKAIAALDKKDMIVYAMHKAALEVGCAQLETIMRASNPIDPSNQLATLATAMGISPTPFTSLLQNSTATSLNSNLLAADAATREQLTAPYSLPPAVSMEFQGYTERDISSFLL
ncbi:hypothetical protein NECAME_11731 [Necator americanus]|uniref:Uncharacterized protein n=1 Tax=Necator americanus TaxID=51031 RepID=W2T5Y2_NECAM|nr:hypothetical protein NECAME_11731 [Necator americanus]ETN76377.1 hypothetical protein NECAME_11731 [Necator americanus]